MYTGVTNVKVIRHDLPRPYDAGYKKGKEDVVNMILSATETLRKNCRGFNSNEILAIINSELLELLEREGALL